MEFLLTLPPRMAREFKTLEGPPQANCFVAGDPPGPPPGSGGATANLLTAAWLANEENLSFSDWLQASRKLILHGGGPSHRLPAYAPTGKLLTPIPAFRGSRGQRLDQTLLSVPMPHYERVLSHAAPGTVALLARGDVLLRFGQELPPFPAVDVLGLGMWVKAEQFKDFGVFFSPRQQPNALAYRLHRPSLAQLRESALEHIGRMDTGLWLLSERAVQALLERCGWDGSRFKTGQAKPCDLYHEFGQALGTRPQQKDSLVNALSCAVVLLPEAELYPIDTNRQLIESISALQNRELDETKLGLTGAKRHPDQFLQNSTFEVPIGREENHTLWVENSVVPPTWKLAHDHVLTGVPPNQWPLTLRAGVCLDFVPVSGNETCIRCYGFDDSFTGPFRDTQWLGEAATRWFEARAIPLTKAGVAPEGDIQAQPLFPVVRLEELSPEFLAWLFAAEPESRDGCAEQWLSRRRISAQQLCSEADLERLYQQRAGNRRNCLRPLLDHSRWSVFFKLDLESTAALYAASDFPLPASRPPSKDDLEPLNAVHEEMFRSAVLRHRRQEGWQGHEANAFGRLREMIVRDAQLSPVLPQRHVLDDQIIWGRSPVRLDIAGGWTDTPPYCLEQGGKVVNMAVDLNGQPPIQVFARLCPRPEIVVRSIDLGKEQHLRTYEDVDTYAIPGSEFALAKAALALAGFLPRFHAHGGCSSLEEQLREFGGGLEISLLSAVPKGSGLGASSILAATVLATLGDLCGLAWDQSVLFQRTLALEQMLTTGGGWQDQAGAIYRGIKTVETSPGLAQKATLRWLPESLLKPEYANQSILLYYTGITRLAKGILQEIVRGIFLNSPAHLATIAAISANADRASQAIQRCDYAQLAAVIRTSWRLNQELDAGTNPPEVQAILDPVQDWLAGAKLLGAGGGGYLLMLAKDAAAGAKIRRALQAHPPNARARFVEFSLSETGLQLTRS